MRCYHCMKELNKTAKFCPFCGKEPDKDNPPHHLAVGTVLHDKYIIGNSIGEGGFGITYIGCDSTLDLKIAVKEFYPSGYANRSHTLTNNITINYENQGEYFRNGKESFLREAKSIAKFSSEDGIVDVRDYFTENNTAYIVMEFLDGENLNRYIRANGCFYADDLVRLMIPVMRSLQKIHNERIIHRDISPDNIMYLKSGTLKLMDFGSARYFAGVEQKTMSVMLKPGYAPYEQYSSNGQQGPWTDVYGMCATIYKCITGVTPPDSLDRYQNDTLKPPSQLGAVISPAMENVLMYGMAIYHNNRCQSMEELIGLLQKALNNQPVYFKNAGSSEIADSIDRTRKNDDRYKTMFAEAKYPPEQPLRQYRQQAQGSWQNYQQSYQQPYPPQKPKKNNAALIATLISLTVFVVAAIGVFTAVIINMDRNDGEKEAAHAALSEVSENQSSANEQSRNTSGTASSSAGSQTPYVPLESSSGETTKTPGEPQSETRRSPAAEIDYSVPDTKPLKSASFFSSASASSVLPDEEGYNYSASNVLKDDGSCWCEGASGAGVGEWIELRLPEKQLVSGIKLINGYAGTEKQYSYNNKITQMRIEFSDGQSTTVNLKVFSDSQRRIVQEVKLSEPVETEYVKLTILNVSEGTGTQKGNCNDTCLTYAEPY